MNFLCTPFLARNPFQYKVICLVYATCNRIRLKWHLVIMWFRCEQKAKWNIDRIFTCRNVFTTTLFPYFLCICCHISHSVFFPFGGAFLLLLPCSFGFHIFCTNTNWAQYVSVGCCHRAMCYAIACTLSISGWKHTSSERERKNNNKLLDQMAKTCWILLHFRLFMHYSILI